MASATYKDVLREARQLTPLEQIRLSAELSHGIDIPSGADFIAAMKRGEQLDPAIVDEMERIIEEGCEQIESNA
jgi:hypothetical protein